MNSQRRDQSADDIRWMQQAIAQAEEALARGDWPTGAVLVRGGIVLAQGQNRQNSAGNPLLHAETDALQQAFATHGIDAVRGSTLYCTMEPCPMCAGALKIAGVRTLVLALRHARLGRTDLGSYRFEAFCALTGYDADLRDGVLEGRYLALRLRWGKDAVASKH